MKHIIKNDEPPELNHWKNRVNDPENDGWRPTWRNFQNPEKTIVHNALIKDQGHICCYCMREIGKETSHIEHVNPRSGTGEEERLSYANMLTSCDAEDQQKRNGQNGNDELLQQHCGHYRQTWYDTALYVSPLIPDCEKRFRFYDDGAIRPVDDDPGAKATIEKLRLNYSLLIKNRKAAITDATFDIDTLTDAQIVERFREFSERDADGKFKEYCTAVQQVLSRLVSSGLVNQGNE
jgi:uncharacterized protein (TIGR02646 family)